MIPLGSALITRDLSAILKIEMEQAEQIKCTYGLYNLISGQDGEETILLNDRNVSLNEIGEIIEARNEEIIRNVAAQIRASGYSDVLYAGIVLTGGGSQLRQLDQVFMKIMDTVRKPRVVAEPLCGVVWNEQSWKRGDGSQLALLSVMAKGDENCCELPKMDAIDNIAPENQDKVIQGALFTEDGESAQEERDRKEQEERRQALEAAEKDDQEKASETPVKGGAKRHNFFKSLFDNFINYSEDFFEDKEDKNTGK